MPEFQCIYSVGMWFKYFFLIKTFIRTWMFYFKFTVSHLLVNDMLYSRTYRGMHACAMNTKSILHASIGIWGLGGIFFGVSFGFPLVRSRSTSSWRKVSHLSGSPKITIHSTAGKLFSSKPVAFKWEVKGTKELLLKTKVFFHLHKLIILNLF